MAGVILFPVVVLPAPWLDSATCSRCWGRHICGESYSFIWVVILGRERYLSVDNRNYDATTLIFKIRDILLMIGNSELALVCYVPTSSLFPCSVYFNFKGVSYLILSSCAKWILYFRDSTIVTFRHSVAFQRSWRCTSLGWQILINFCENFGCRRSQVKRGPQTDGFQCWDDIKPFLWHF